jgi:hypothetical protein
VGGGTVRSPLPDASKPLGLFRAGLNIRKFKSLINTCSESHSETHNSNILYETRSR